MNILIYLFAFIGALTTAGVTAKYAEMKWDDHNDFHYTWFIYHDDQGIELRCPGRLTVFDEDRLHYTSVCFGTSPTSFQSPEELGMGIGHNYTGINIAPAWGHREPDHKDEPVDLPDEEEDFE